MRILNVQATNFGSYKELNFQFDADGLSLIQGPTGSGKSTLCDIIPWCLFGKTSKGGAVDEVLSWPRDCKTEVVANLAGRMYITRTRGPKPKDNDLFIMELGHHKFEDNQPKRGKDILDTQKLINSILGMDYGLYLASAYYHEFNQTAQFFTTTAKNRRQICEQLVDLSLAVKLKENAKTKEKDLYQSLTMLNSEISTLTSNISLLKRLQETENNKAKDWESSKLKRLSEAERFYRDFELNRKKTISKKCNSCGTVLQTPREVVDESENPWLETLERVGAEQNPHSDTAKDFRSEINEKLSDIDVLEHLTGKAKADASELEELSIILDTYRSTRIANTIDFVETKTNQLLTDFFDAEIRVKFEVESADKLEVSIYKDGNTASFTQLSKGQRQLLKLCFGLAVMETVQNHHGIDINQIFIDEGTDGLDDGMKLKALRMLESKAQFKSIYLVEHSETIKAMVDSKYSVTLTNGESQIEKV